MASAAAADPIRIATYNVELARGGPGLLLRDILQRASPDIEVAIGVIAYIKPDVIVLTSFDYDYEGHALSAFSSLLAMGNSPYPYQFALAPNTGLQVGVDVDADGRLGGPADAQSYGAFRGQGGLAILSRWPILEDQVQSLTELKWLDFHGAIPPVNTYEGQRLSTTGHWDVPIDTPTQGRLRILAYHASPPVFDGPEDRNGRRNHDETALWLAWLDGDLAGVPPETGFVIAGDANLDPVDGDGRSSAIRRLLEDPRLQDPFPRSDGGVAASQRQGGANEAQTGDPSLDTVDWSDEAPGNLRVDYVLPSVDWSVVGSGVFWPDPGDPLVDLLGSDGAATRHRLVWVDIERSDGGS